jgi:MFS family permease
MSKLDDSVTTGPTNGGRLFFASFLTLIAAGIGFSIRGAILGQWASQFGFTQSQLGDLNGFGLVGFGFTIIAWSFVGDRIGYGPLMVAAFVLHLLSGVVTLAATPVFALYGGNNQSGAYWCLAIGGFLFSLANGTCEAVINPLTATLFPRAKTHWLNILHAGWPGGLVLGALLGLVFGYMGNVRWEIQMGMFLLPTLLYGILMLGQRFPHSEAKAAGIGLGTMLLEFLSPILIFLVLIHALVGYVELGTDSWIQNITGNILNNASYGTMLFIWTSSLMFALRFFAGPIVHKISPLGLLFCSAVLGCVGLLLLGNAPTNATLLAGLFCVLAATVYGFGKTFFWPTMLGVVSERFPKGGALTLGMVGGVGMISAGMLGAPGIGYKQDFFASRNLQGPPSTAPESSSAFKRYAAEHENSFLFFPAVRGLDGSRVATLLGEPGKDNGNGKTLQGKIEALERAGRNLSDDKQLEQLNTWWQNEGKPHAGEDKDRVREATLYGGQMALALTAGVPATMALCYLLLIIYFRARGGYKAEVLLEHKADDEEFTGGVEGPAEM